MNKERIGKIMVNLVVIVFMCVLRSFGSAEAKTLFLAHFNKGLDADYSAVGKAKAYIDGAKVTTDKSGYPFSESQPSPESADIGYSGGEDTEGATLLYEAPGNVNVQQGTVEMWVKAKLPWRAKPWLRKPNPGGPGFFGVNLRGGGSVSLYWYNYANKEMIDQDIDHTSIGMSIADKSGNTHSIYYCVSDQIKRMKKEDWVQEYWYHIAGTWTPTKCQVFVNGKLVAERVFEEPIEIGPPDDYFYIGCDPTSQQATEVLIDELRISDVPLTEKDFQISKEYKNE